MSTPLPPLNLSAPSSATSRSGDLFSTYGPKNSAFNVSYGNGVNLPWYVWAGAAVAALVYFKKLKV